jgi:hypothetical protein
MAGLYVCGCGAKGRSERSVLATGGYVDRPPRRLPFAWEYTSHATPRLRQAQDLMRLSRLDARANSTAGGLFYPTRVLPWVGSGRHGRETEDGAALPPVTGLPKGVSDFRRACQWGQ